MSELSVYFARGMDGRSGADVFLDDEKYSQLLAGIKASLVNPFTGHIHDYVADGYTVATSDLARLQDADVVLADLTVPGYQYVGCIFEIVHAFIQNVPVILTVGKSGFHNRAFFQAYCEFITREASEAVQYLRRAHTGTGIQEQITEMMAYYDEAASDYNNMSSGSDPHTIGDREGFLCERNELRNLLSRYIRGSACELGVGTGDWTQTICENATKVIGVDAGQKMLEEARIRLSNFDNIRLVRRDVLNESLESGPHDCVILYFFLSLLPPPAQDRLFDLLIGLVKPGGLLIVADTKRVLNQPSIGLGRRRLQTRSINGRTFTLYKEHFVGDTLKKLLQTKGYEVVESSEASTWFSWAVSRRPR